MTVLSIDPSNDGVTSIQLENRIGRSLNEFFNSRAVKNITSPLTPGAVLHDKVDLDIYWTATGLVVPPGYFAIALYSRNSYSYGTLTIIPGGIPNCDAYFGFEAGNGAGNGIFTLHPKANNLYLQCGVAVVSNVVSLLNVLPADWQTSISHAYLLKLNKNNAECYIDGVLKGVVLHGLADAIPTTTTLPYIIYGVKGAMPSSMTTLIELDNIAFTLQINPSNISGNNLNNNVFVACDGDPNPPRAYPLYTTGTSTSWATTGTVAVGDGLTVLSHPVPVWGYSKKTLYWKATNVTASFQEYIAGAWQTDPITITSNGALQVIDIPNNASIVRLSVLGRRRYYCYW